MKNISILTDAVMQQNFPRMQDPLGRPPNKEQADPGAQIPASPLGEAQVGIQASKLANKPLKCTRG
jgi:hypothetical protein